MFSPRSSEVQKKGDVYSDPQNINPPESTASDITVKPNKQRLFLCSFNVIIFNNLKDF